MTDFPPFCPNRNCIHHRRLPPAGAGRWYRLAGSYSTKAFGPVQRYRCRACRRSFSAQTFALDYFIKLPIDYRELFSRITSGSGLRSIGRKLQLSHQIIGNRISRLARQALALQARLLVGFALDEDLAADGFESFVASQYEPNNIHLLVGATSQFLYEFDYAHLRRKGRMSAAQKDERERREGLWVRPPVSISASFSHILESLEGLLAGRVKERVRLFTDERHEYHRLIDRSPPLQSLRRRGLFSHLRISSKKARTLTNRLFPVNYWDRELRKDNADHVRETVQFSRSVASCLERIAVYQMWHNYFKPYRIDDGPKSRLLHGQVAGIDRERIEAELEGIFERRRFLSRVRLSWSQALVWFRMVGNLERRSGGYWPAYVWM